MPVSGLAITLTDNELHAAAALDALTAHPAVQIGQRIAGKLSIATDTTNSKADCALQQWIGRLPGVAHIDVTFIAFDDTGTLNVLAHGDD